MIKPPISIHSTTPIAYAAPIEMETKMKDGRFDAAIDPKIMTREHFIGMLRTTGRLYLYAHQAPILTVPVRSHAAATFLAERVGGGVKAEPAASVAHVPYSWGIWGQPFLDLLADLAPDLTAMHKAVYAKYSNPADIPALPKPAWWPAPDNRPYAPPPSTPPLSAAASTLIAGARALASIPEDPSLPAHWNAMLASMRAAVREFDTSS